MSGSRRPNVNGHPPLEDDIQSPTQHENIPNHINYDTIKLSGKHTHSKSSPQGKPEHIFQLFYVNPNGISVMKHKSEFIEIYHTMTCFLVHMICLTEHNLDTSHHTTHQQIYQTAKNTFNHTRLNFASSPIPSTALFKPGGTIMMSQVPITAQITATGTDSIGGWTYQTLN